MHVALNKRQNWWPHFAVLAAYTLLTLVMTWPLAFNWATAIPGDSFDGWQNYWNQWWIKVALVDRLQNPYFTDLLYAPTGVELYFHTLNPFNGLTTLPIQLSLGLIPAYNGVVLISWVLGGYGVYLLALWVLGQRLEVRDWRSESSADRPISTLQPPVSNHLAAFFAGLVFTFSPFHMAHLLGHMQVMALEWLPFYVLYLLRAIGLVQHSRSWRRSALMAGLFLVLAGLCDWYFVLYLLFFPAFAVLWSWLWPATSRRSASFVQRFSAPVAPALVAGALFLLLLGVILVPMVREARQFSFMVRPAADLYTFSASLMDFLVPNRLHTLWRAESMNWVGNQVAPLSERTISIGYLPLVLALVAAWRDRRRSGFWLVCAFCFALLALGPRLHLGNITAADIPTGNTISEQWTPYALLNRLVPFMRISRSVSRYALMVQLCVAVAAGIGLAAFARLLWPGGKPSRAALPRLAVLAACLILLFEDWVAPYPLSPPDTPAFYQQLKSLPDTGAVLNLPMNYDRPGYLLDQTVHEKPLTVAYISRDDPRTLTERAPLLQHLRHLGPDILDVDPAQVGLTVLHDLGIGTVVLDRYKMPGGLEREYTEQVAAALFAGQQPLYSDERITAYHVPAPATAAPYLLLGPTGWGPLQGEEGAARFRLVGAAPALVTLLHAPAGGALQVRYRTLDEAGLTISGPDQAILATLPPAPAGHTALVDLGAAQHVALQATGAGGVAIESLGLVPAP